LRGRGVTRALALKQQAVPLCVGSVVDSCTAHPPCLPTDVGDGTRFLRYLPYPISEEADASRLPAVKSPDFQRAKRTTARHCNRCSESGTAKQEPISSETSTIPYCVDTIGCYCLSTAAAFSDRRGVRPMRHQRGHLEGYRQRVARVTRRASTRVSKRRCRASAGVER